MCIQGDWSNLADAKIKSGIAALALGAPPVPGTTLCTSRAIQTPRPWGITALFTEYTGVHEPLAFEWAVKPSLPNLRVKTSDAHSERVIAAQKVVAAEEVVGEPRGDDAVAAVTPVAPVEVPGRIERSPGSPFATVADFARALNRLDPIALELAAGDPVPDMSIEGLAVKQLLGTFWFRSIFPRLSPSWRERLLDAFATNVVIPNHVLWRGRQAVHFADASYDELKEIASKAIVNGAAGTDLSCCSPSRACGEKRRGSVFGLSRLPRPMDSRGSARRIDSTTVACVPLRRLALLPR